VRRLSRPSKQRYICELPKYVAFGPLGQKALRESCIMMTVDEYETIRLIDYEGYNQEECALQMEVARTTAQRIYNSARRKLAAALVEGRSIKIEGGHYQVCSGQRQMRQETRRCQHKCRKRGKED